ncbi:MAG: hypothetical protein E7L31_07330 [Aeromonas sp.]|uniref:hypothetical protein n=1 Tax=Aeromonas sp. sif0611 TaxID=2854787 RepID=UPI001C43D814|nr:hypothetical protein [Aeromonas sp. sif0611]MBV7469156.1 hypothetical protein [Aeromonas sp. sif0611]MDU7311189.1 hypothetical protein [Aeromonas sp.]
MNQLKRLAIYLVGLVEELIKESIKTGLMIVFACLGFMTVEFVSQKPLDLVATSVNVAAATALLGLLLAIITTIKWAWRKRQALNGG